MNRIIVTGANGAGKSHLARRLARARPEVPVLSLDAIKLTENWQTKPRSEIDTILISEVAQEAWILEGGPSLLPLAIERADALIWLDPPDYLRAWRLLKRPWKNRGKTRSELPNGNLDWPLQQYRFAWVSLKNRSKFRSQIEGAIQTAQNLTTWHCKTNSKIEIAVKAWAKG